MAGVVRERGGILWLLDLIEEHRGSLEYDWRSRFQLSLSEVGVSMGWSEGIRLVRILLADPASAVASAMAGWDYPMPREAAILADLYDLTFAANKSEKSKMRHYPRPWKVKSEAKVAKPTISQARVIAALRRAGHMKELPTAG